MSSPSKRIAPPHLAQPEIVFSVVVLPAPLAPTSEVTVPCGTENRDASDRFDVTVVDLEVVDLETSSSLPGRQR